MGKTDGWPYIADSLDVARVRSARDEFGTSRMFRTKPRRARSADLVAAFFLKRPCPGGGRGNNSLTYEQKYAEERDAVPGHLAPASTRVSHVRVHRMAAPRGSEQRGVTARSRVSRFPSRQCRAEAVQESKLAASVRWTPDDRVRSGGSAVTVVEYRRSEGVSVSERTHPDTPWFCLTWSGLP